MGQYYLTQSHSINEGTYQTITFDFIMTRNGTSISDVLKGFDKEEVIESLQDLNNSLSITYNSNYLKNKLILADIKKKRERSYVISVSAISTILFFVVICIFIYALKKMSFCSKNKTNYFKTKARYTRHNPPTESDPPLNTSAISFPELEINDDGN